MGLSCNRGKIILRKGYTSNLEVLIQFNHLSRLCVCEIKWKCGDTNM